MKDNKIEVVDITQLIRNGTVKDVTMGVDAERLAKQNADRPSPGLSIDDDITWADRIRSEIEAINFKMEDKKKNITELESNIEVCSGRIAAAEKILKRIVGVNSVAARDLAREATRVSATEAEKRTVYQTSLGREKRILAEFQRQFNAIDHKRYQEIQQTARLVAEMGNTLR
jgi:septal ring factor EnvC (AmiA/AmiB activator)